jgi:CO dehydrogenase nickel-insertion accessory protein CooC1
MLIMIWGRDGSGKSMLADHLGNMLSRDSLAAVIDSDLTQPTLPVRLSGLNFRREKSLGRAIAGTGTSEAKSYLHQHPDCPGLFFAGLLNDDDYLSYEIGLEAEPAAAMFIRHCQDTVDQVILDCSGQRTDPFVPIGLQSADQILIVLTPDLQGICWWKSVEPLLKQLNIIDKIKLILSPVQKHHQVDWIELGIGREIPYSLPYTPELNEFRCSALPSTRLNTRGGRKWLKAADRIFQQLIELRSDAS